MLNDKFKKSHNFGFGQNYNVSKSSYKKRIENYKEAISSSQEP